MANLGKKSWYAAQRLIADLWDEWPGDDPTLLHEVVLDWLQDFVVEASLRQLSGFKLVAAANEAADDFYCDLIQIATHDIFHQAKCRQILMRGLLNVAGPDLTTLRFFTIWHDLLTAALRTMRLTKKHPKDEV